MGRSVSIDKIVEGMILSSPQVYRFGQVLLPKGTTITSNHLRLLKTWGIERVSVEMDDDDDQLTDEYLYKQSEVEKILRMRMLWDPTNIYELDMYRAVVNTKTNQ